MEYIPPKHRLGAFTCPNCGAIAHQMWYYAHKDDNTTMHGQPYMNRNTVDGFEVALCSHCKKYSIWLAGQMVYPNISHAPLPNPDMPPDVKQDYEEAREIAQKSPRGAAALLRLAIQKLVVHLGESGDNLNDDIANLVKKGLPPALQQALDSVRVVGNNAVHPGQIELTDNTEIVNKLFVFVNVICENQISIPKQIGEYYQNVLPDGAKTAIENRDKQP